MKFNSPGCNFSQGLLKKHHSYKLGIHQLDMPEEKDKDPFINKINTSSKAVPEKMVNEIPS